MMNRSSGILMPIFSLPSPFGIGSFDENALQFAQKALDAGFKYWQILPLNPTSAGDSPYQGLSAYAGNPYFIDLQQLYDQGLLTQDELDSAKYPWDQSTIDYGRLYETREKLLHLAYYRINDEKRWFVGEFVAKNHRWLPDYALFRAIKKANGDRPWWEWQDEGLRRHDHWALGTFAAVNSAEVGYHQFVQYEFDQQWQALKKQVNALGIEFIGDMPIYVSQDSADAWARTDLFEMDSDSHLLRVAGVPPDYFSADGQLWGNPLYRWDVMRDQGYAWWLDRIGTALTQVDVLRIDHFRGFESYWAVPAGETTARKGVWEKGPAMDLFNRVLSTFPDAPIIAEDLGDIDDEVRAFLNATGLPGMKVMQFGFDGYFDGKDLPHSHIPNSVVYSGTHDNTTTVAWWKTADEAQVEQVNRYIRYQPLDQKAGEAANDLNFCRSFLQTLWLSPAHLAVAPIQDFLGLGAEARINTPGTSEGNWRFRATTEQLQALDIDWIADMNKAYFRFNTRHASDTELELEE
ncbi:MAG: 4-alpha-glucanotransferase [Eubacteriales bacterium]|nr:4-alpha-glucanotransferase [Eubacteriales bacterium]